MGVGAVIRTHDHILTSLCVCVQSQQLSTKAIKTVYCDMTRTLGGSTSGWMRIAKLDVENCPQGFNTTIYDSVNTCIRSDSSAGCTEINYSTHNVRYSNISGAVRALSI